VGALISETILAGALSSGVRLLAARHAVWGKPGYAVFFLLTLLFGLAIVMVLVISVRKSIKIFR
jgi:hypothetical protein